jgi:probable F420-dependent oxidoreductase
MKFGVILPSYMTAATVEGIRETAQRAEALGYDSVWTTDHVMIGRDRQIPYGSIFEAVTTLGWLAGLTSRIRLGISVVVVPQRQPVVLAKELATLDRLSGGRIVLGAGAGWLAEEFGYLGADFHQRGRMLDEAIDSMRQLWTEPEKPFAGKLVRFENHSFAPPPAQPGGVPIWVGGNSEFAIKRAARRGDGWHGNLAPLDLFRERLALLRSSAPARPQTVSARATVRAERAETSSRQGAALTLGGSAQTLLDDVQRFAEAGMDQLMLGFWDGDLAQHFDGMERFAAEVMGRLEGAPA